MNRRMLQRLSMGLIVAIGSGLIAIGVVDRVARAQSTPPPAQTDGASISTFDTWQRVYQLLPSFPREDQYISRETGKQAESSTLASRMIYYHTFIKGRPPNYRLDWKLTLADYLGANERINAETYPGADTLRTNPMPGDVAAIQKLNRVQRDQLVDVLVSIFSQPQFAPPDAPAAAPSAAPATPAPTPAARPAPSPADTGNPLFPRTPQPGDARLLQP